MADVIIGCCNLIVEDGRYLLVREAKESACRRYNLPAGKPEVGETLVEAARREAREETGLEIDVDHLVGVYHCPQTSEGFGVVNFVFACRAVGGSVSTYPAHPEVGYFSRAEVADLARERLIRGTHIERAIDAYERGTRLPLELVETVPASPLRDWAADDQRVE